MSHGRHEDDRDDLATRLSAPVPPPAPDLLPRLLADIPAAASLSTEASRRLGGNVRRGAFGWRDAGRRRVLLAAASLVLVAGGATVVGTRVARERAEAVAASRVGEGAAPAHPAAPPAATGAVRQPSVAAAPPASGPAAPPATFGAAARRVPPARAVPPPVESDEAVPSLPPAEVAEAEAGLQDGVSGGVAGGVAGGVEGGVVGGVAGGIVAPPPPAPVRQVEEPRRDTAAEQERGEVTTLAAEAPREPAGDPVSTVFSDLRPGPWQATATAGPRPSARQESAEVGAAGAPAGAVAEEGWTPVAKSAASPGVGAESVASAVASDALRRYVRTDGDVEIAPDPSLVVRWRRLGTLRGPGDGGVLWELELRRVPAPDDAIATVRPRSEGPAEAVAAGSPRWETASFEARLGALAATLAVPARARDAADRETLRARAAALVRERPEDPRAAALVELAAAASVSSPGE